MITPYLILPNLIMVFVFILRYRFLPPQIPLFYSHYASEEQLADVYYIFIIPILTNIFFLINNYFGKKFFPENYLIQKIFFYLNIFLMISATVLFLRIILLVT